MTSFCCPPNFSTLAHQPCLLLSRHMRHAFTIRTGTYYSFCLMRVCRYSHDLLLYFSPSQWVLLFRILNWKLTCSCISYLLSLIYVFYSTIWYTIYFIYFIHLYHSWSDSHFKNNLHNVQLLSVSFTVLSLVSSRVPGIWQI